jgi:NADPH-dependent curcumin reductase CurA
VDGLAELAVGDDVDPGLRLLPDDVGDGLPQRALVLGRVERLPVAARLQDPPERRRADEAPDVRGQDALRAVHLHSSSRHLGRHTSTHTTSAYTQRADERSGGAMSERTVEGWIIDHPYSAAAWEPDVLRWDARSLRAPGDGELLIRPIHLSLDPSNLVWAQLDRTYIVPLRAGDPMIGMVLAEVEESRADGFAPGDMVLAFADWTTRAVVGTGPGRPVPPVKVQRIPGLPLAVGLTVFSHIGLAAMIGIREVARVRAGETVLVSAAAGAVGGLAAQVAKASGCRVVGIAGGPQKCALLLGELGLDGAIDHREGNLDAALAEACPEGVDVYFDNVGGEILDAALMHLNDGARVAVCGQISQYFADAGHRPPGVRNLYELVVRNVRMEGFVPTERHAPRFPALLGELASLLAQGSVTHRAHLVHGFESVPEALTLLQTGGNLGKLIAQVAPDPWA